MGIEAGKLATPGASARMGQATSPAAKNGSRMLKAAGTILDGVWLKVHNERGSDF